MKMQIDDFLDLVKSRRSIRVFKPDPIPRETIEKILEAGRWAMSGANGQPWEFVVVQDRVMIEKIAELYAATSRKDGVEFETHLREELRQPWIYTAKGPPGFKDAPVIIAICGDMRRVQASVVQAWLISGQDILLENLANCSQIIHLAAAALGLVSQWVSICRVYEPEFKALLGVPAYFRIPTIIPIGYSAYEPGTAYRRELSEIVHWENYDMSKYKSNEDITNWLVELRKRMQVRYPVVRKSAKE